MTQEQEEITLNCYAIEAIVKKLAMQGIVKDEELVKIIDSMFHPTTQYAMERYSEVIVCAKCSVLN